MIPLTYSKFQKYCPEVFTLLDNSLIKYTSKAYTKIITALIRIGLEYINTGKEFVIYPLISFILNFRGYDSV